MSWDNVLPKYSFYELGLATPGPALVPAVPVRVHIMNSKILLPFVVTVSMTATARLIPGRDWLMYPRGQNKHFRQNRLKTVAQNFSLKLQLGCRLSLPCTNPPCDMLDMFREPPLE